MKLVDRFILLLAISFFIIGIITYAIFKNFGIAFCTFIMGGVSFIIEISKKYIEKKGKSSKKEISISYKIDLNNISNKLKWNISYF